jgi:hypothetical protein
MHSIERLGVSHSYLATNASDSQIVSRIKDRKKTIKLSCIWVKLRLREFLFSSNKIDYLRIDRKSDKRRPIDAFGGYYYK